MTVQHGKPGRYAKHEASRQIHRIMWVLLLTAMVGSLVLGFVYGRFRSWHVLWGVLLIGAVMLAMLRLIDKPIDRLARRRVNYMRGAQGEALVGWLLREQLPDAWHVFHGLQLREASDIDHIVVGPGGLFCISTKSNRGLYSVAPDGTYLLNNRPTDHLKQAQRQTMQLRDRLAALLGRVPWVQPVLAVPLAWVDFDSFQTTAWVLHQDNLCDAMEKQPKRLTKDEVARIVKALEMIEANARDIYRPPEPRSEAGRGVTAAPSCASGVAAPKR